MKRGCVVRWGPPKPEHQCPLRRGARRCPRWSGGRNLDEMAGLKLPLSGAWHIISLPPTGMSTIASSCGKVPKEHNSDSWNLSALEVRCGGGGDGHLGSQLGGAAADSTGEALTRGRGRERSGEGACAAAVRGNLSSWSTISLLASFAQVQGLVARKADRTWQTGGGRSFLKA